MGHLAVRLWRAPLRIATAGVVKGHLGGLGAEPKSTKVSVSPALEAIIMRHRTRRMPLQGGRRSLMFVLI